MEKKTHIIDWRHKETRTVAPYSEEARPDKNGDGYSDPTAGAAITRVDSEIDRFNRLLKTIFYLCELAGFSIEGRIVLVDKETGRIWR